MSGVLARHDNVVDVDFSGPASPPPEAGPEDSSWWPWAEGAERAPGKPPAATRPLPARYSPRPVRVLRRRFARSQLAADLRDYALLIGLLAAGVICAVLHDHFAQMLTGGPR